MSKFTVNGKAQNFNGDPETPLLWFLRDIAGMTGTKFGCGRALCGACTVHLDGTAVRSCQVQVGDIDGQTVITIEGLSADGNHPVQKAWRELNVAQCGYCQTGQIMQAVSLLKDTPSPGPADPRRHERQHLPLRHLSAHSGRHQARLGQGIGEGMTMTNTTEVTNVARRSVLLGLAAGTFVLSVRLSSPAQAQEKKFGGDGMPGGVKEDPKLFLSIADDGTVNLLCIRAEMGQGIRTSWGMVVADELEADLGRVKVLQAQGDQARYGNQDTDGSRSMRHHFEPLRRIAAAARMMLEQEAAARWACRSPRSRPRTTASSMPRAAGASTSARSPRGRRRGRCRPATPWS